MSHTLPIISWYLEHKRDLPWRDTTDPYRIWLSEVILQQTRVEQGLPYYYRFIERYHSIGALAAADEDEVMKLWQGLGYYSRAVNMLNTAKIIAQQHGGRFPGSYNGLITLKGIGPYTAAAVASFAFNEPRAVLDGNVYRVLSRVFAIDEPINSGKGKKIFSEVAQEVLDTAQPALFNQAIMEIGALVCKPQNPRCGECPLRLKCQAYAEGRVNEFPVKLKKQAPRTRFLNYIFINHHHKTYIRQRTEKGIWHKLYEPPCIETAEAATAASLQQEPAFRELFHEGDHDLKAVYSTRHQLTHQTIHAVFWELKENISLPPPYAETELADLHRYAVHRLFDKFLNYHTLQE